MSSRAQELSNGTWHAYSPEMQTNKVLKIMKEITELVGTKNGGHFQLITAHDPFQ